MSTDKSMFLRSTFSMELLGMLYNSTGSEKSKMTNVPTSQLVYTKYKLNFNGFFNVFWGQLFNETMKNDILPNQK